MATSPLTFLSRARGRSITGIAKTGIGGWLLALSATSITGLQAVFQLLFLPIEIFIDIIRQSVESFILGPLGIVDAGAAASESSVAQFEFLGLPLSLVIVLGSFAILAWYLRRESTSDFLPGLFTDPPVPFLGVDEVGDEEGEN